MMRIQPLGDRALVVTFGDELSVAVNERVMRAATVLREAAFRTPLVDVVPAMASLTLHFDGAIALESVAEDLELRLAGMPAPDVSGGAERPVHEIHVRYGAEEGPDLPDVAAFAGMTMDEVVARHAARVYRVYMLGFLPGFAYLGDVEPVIAAPRRATPRQTVPAGSVGIAGGQTGVYPQASPGGWQLIGRTDARMFDTASGQSLLQPGDRVRFIAEVR